MDLHRILNIGGYPARNIVLKGLENSLEKTVKLQNALLNLLGSVPGTIVTMDTLLRKLHLDESDASYETALNYFYDHASFVTLKWGERTYNAHHVHTFVPTAAKVKVVDWTGGLVVRNAERIPAMQLFNNILWTGSVSAITETFTQMQDSTPSSGSPTTTLAMTAPVSAKKGDIVKIYALDMIQEIGTAAQVENAGAGRVGELMMVAVTAVNSMSLVLNGRLRERQYGSDYGGAGYEGSVRVSAYDDHKLKFINYEGTTSKIGTDAWRGWGHTELFGFSMLELESPYIHDHYGHGFWINDSWAPVITNSMSKNLDNNIVKNRYGYGIVPAGATRDALIINPRGINCRHIIDSGSSGNANNISSLSQPWNFGVPYDATIIGGISYGLQNGAWNTHHNCRGFQFINCRATDTFVGDDSGGPAFDSRGVGVTFDGIWAKSTRAICNLTCASEQQLVNSNLEFGWVGPFVSCNHRTYLKNNILNYTGIFANNGMLNFAGGFGSRPSTVDDPVLVGSHTINMRAEADATHANVFQLSKGAHILLTDDIYVDFRDFKGDAAHAGGIGLVSFSSSDCSFLRNPGKKIIIEGGDSDGDVYRFLDSFSNDYVLSTLTRVGSVATANTHDFVGVPVNHGLSVGDDILMIGATGGEFNGDITVATVPTPSSFTYAVVGTPASPDMGAPKFRKYFKPLIDIEIEYRHNSKAEGGIIDGMMGRAQGTFQFKRVINGSTIRSSETFNYSPTGDGFVLNNPSELSTHYNLGGTGGWIGAAIGRSTNKDTSYLHLFNSSSRPFFFPNPPLCVPPNGHVTLIGNKDVDWTRFDSVPGEQLLFAGSIDLSVAGDHEIKKATGIQQVNYQWVGTRFLLVCQSGGDSGDSTDGHLFLLPGGGAAGGQQFLVTAGTDWNALIPTHCSRTAIAIANRYYTQNSLYLEVGTPASHGASICDVYAYGIIV